MYYMRYIGLRFLFIMIRTNGDLSRRRRRRRRHHHHHNHRYSYYREGGKSIFFFPSFFLYSSFTSLVLKERTSVYHKNVDRLECLSSHFRERMACTYIYIDR